MHRGGQPFDLLVVGGGPAGIACALQAGRDDLAVMLVSDQPLGGLLRAARRLDNFPGADGISGRGLSDRMAHQVEACGLPHLNARVIGLAPAPGGFRAVLSDHTELLARTVCLATGTRPRRWDCPGTPTALPRDARDLPDRLAGTRTLVIGGGEAALDTALTVRDRGGAVELLARGKLRAPAWMKQEACESGVGFCLDSVPERIATGPDSWVVSCRDQAGSARNLMVQHLVVCIGREPRDELQEAAKAVPGVFLAGDLIRTAHRYAALAMADGLAAAIAAAVFLGKEGR